MKNEAMVGSNSKRYKRALALGPRRPAALFVVQRPSGRSPSAESQSVGAVCRSARVKQRSSLQAGGAGLTPHYWAQTLRSLRRFLLLSGLN